MKHDVTTYTNNIRYKDFLIRLKLNGLKTILHMYYPSRRRPTLSVEPSRFECYTRALSLNLSVFRKPDSWSPIGAGEWGNSASTYLLNSGCWKTVSSPSTSDIASNGVHVVVMTGYKTTTGASWDKVTKGNWGFDPTDNNRVANVFWRYTC